MAKAKVTSKGQVTVPAEVRRALGIEEGDVLAFETHADYVVVRRARTLEEVVGEIRRKHPPARDTGERKADAIGRYFREIHQEDLGDDVIVVGPEDVVTVDDPE